jgi:hypothetical protein
MDFAPNTRVEVAQDYYWAKGATGTIVMPPDHIVGLSPGWTGHKRWDPLFPGGGRSTYWVRFDEAQRDQDGDGPYSEGEIDARALRAVPIS